MTAHKWVILLAGILSILAQSSFARLTCSKKNIDLRGDFPPIESQGLFPVCARMAGKSLVEQKIIRQSRKNGTLQDDKSVYALSAFDVNKIHEAHNSSPKHPADLYHGADPGQVLEALQAEGKCYSNKKFPFDPNQHPQAKPAAAAVAKEYENRNVNCAEPDCTSTLGDQLKTKIAQIDQPIQLLSKSKEKNHDSKHRDVELPPFNIRNVAFDSDEKHVNEIYEQLAAGNALETGVCFNKLMNDKRDQSCGPHAMVIAGVQGCNLLIRNSHGNDWPSDSKKNPPGDGYISIPIDEYLKSAKMKSNDGKEHFTPLVSLQDRNPEDKPQNVNRHFGAEEPVH